MKRLYDILRLIWKCRRSLLLFETVYKLAAFALFVPFFNGAFSFLMRAGGYRYLTAENIPGFILHPLTLAFLAVLFIMLSAYILIDMTTVLCILNSTAQEIPLTAFDALGSALGKIFIRQKPGRIKKLVYLPFLALYIHIGTAAALALTVRLPFSFSSVLSRPAAAVPAALVGVILTVWIIIRIYALPVQVLENTDFDSACRSSRIFMRMHAAESLAILSLVQFSVILFYAGIGFIGIVIIRAVSAALARSFLTSHVLLFFTASLLAASVISVPLTCSALYTVYTGHRPSSVFPHPPARIIPADRHHLRMLAGFLAVSVSLAACVLTIYRSQRRHFNLNIENLHVMEITAHRGASGDFPENTISAFRGAWEQGADWIETDVHLSCDGVLFCMHDHTFQRTAGRKESAGQLKWEEIRTLDAGSFMRPEFADERIPTLEEAIDFAALYGIRLNIELKPVGQRSGLETAVADLVMEKGFEDMCVITCQKYGSLEIIKQYAPQLTTVYVMSMALGNLEDLQAADHFSISYAFINQAMVDRLHQSGKQIYAWTVDRADIMKRMIDLGIDNIVTNNVPLAVQCVSEENAGILIQTLLGEISDGQEQ